MSDMASASDKNYNADANSNNDSIGGNMDNTQTMWSRRGTAIEKGVILSEVMCKTVVTNMTVSSTIWGTNPSISKFSTSVPTTGVVGSWRGNSAGPFKSFDYSLMYIVSIRDIEKHQEDAETLNAL